MFWVSPTALFVDAKYKPNGAPTHPPTLPHLPLLLRLWRLICSTFYLPLS